MPVIKRYPNRKLYNTETKEYITLEGIADLIRSGEEIRVVDHATGQDLTPLTLTQILFEQVKQHTGFLPRAMLTSLIRTGGSRISAWQRSLLSSFGVKHQVDEEIHRRIEALIDRGELEPQEGDRLLAKLMSLSEEVEQDTTRETSVESILEKSGVATRQELQVLLEKIDALNAKLDEIGKDEPSGPEIEG